MPKKTTTRKRPVKKKVPESLAKSTGKAIKEKWDTTVKSLASAQARVEKEFRHLVHKSWGTGASETLREIRDRVDREGRKALKEVESRFSSLQARVDRERKHLGRLIDDGVHTALVALNIPSRREVKELTRKVDELSRKIDAFKGEPAASRRTAQRKPLSSP